MEWILGKSFFPKNFSVFLSILKLKQWSQAYLCYLNLRYTIAIRAQLIKITSFGLCVKSICRIFMDTRSAAMSKNSGQNDIFFLHQSPSCSVFSSALIFPHYFLSSSNLSNKTFFSFKWLKKKPDTFHSLDFFLLVCLGSVVVVVVVAGIVITQRMLKKFQRIKNFQHENRKYELR